MLDKTPNAEKAPALPPVPELPYKSEFYADRIVRMLSHIDLLLGISYELWDVAETADPLFRLDEKRNYHFLYRPEIKIKEGIYFAILWTALRSCFKPRDLGIVEK